MDRTDKAREAFETALDYLNKGEFEIAKNRFESLLFFYSDLYPKHKIEPYIADCNNKRSSVFANAEKERLRQEALRLQEEARQEEIRKKAEEEERKKEEKKKKEEARRKSFGYFSKYCDADCEILIINEYDCLYNDMLFTANISKENAFSKPLADKMVEPKFSLRLKMIYDGSKCVLLPVMHLYQARILSPINDIYIRIGEDRYHAKVENISTMVLDKVHDSANIVLGLKDIEMLRAMSKKTYPVKIRFGDSTEYIDHNILDEISNFISVIETAGILDQPSLEMLQNQFVKFTSFNTID